MSASTRSPDLPVTVDASRCTWESLDGEILLIDMTTGSLFVLRGLVVPVWNALVRGPVVPAAVAAEASARFDPESGSALAAVIDALGPMLIETDTPGDFAPHGTAPTGIEWPATAEPPSFERFDEIADILTLDPIHDVAPDVGWPHRSDAVDE